MLPETLADIIPVAIAVTISPFPVIAVILMLSTLRARTTGTLFAVGWVVGLIAVCVAMVAVVTLLGDADDADNTPSTVSDILRVILGAFLILLAAKQWRKRPQPGREVETPVWMQSVDRTTPSRSLLLGLALAAVNPKNLLLTFAAAASIARAGLHTADTAIAIAVFIAVGSISVVGAVGSFLVAPEWAGRHLAAVKGFMLANNVAIMMVILLLLGAKVLADGIAGLTG